MKKIKISRNLAILIVSIIIILVLTYGTMTPKDKVAAIVNGENIYLDELTKAYDSLPQQYKESISKKDFLNQLIQAKVIYQEAVKQGAVVTREDASLNFQSNNKLVNISEKQLDEYTKQLTVQKFINDNLVKKINISDEEVSKYYNNPNNSRFFKVGEKVVARSILIGNPEMSAEKQDELTQEILLQLTQENFCEFVTNYSTDTGSVSTCGEYNFTKDDPLVKEFIDLAFNQDVGDMGAVRTKFGSHIIWTVDKIPAKTLAFEEVKNKIADFLKISKTKEKYKDFYDEISKDSEIEIKLIN